MRIKQLDKTQSSWICPNNMCNVHIGVECLHKLDAAITINNIDFNINENSILEFDELYNNATITINHNVWDDYTFLTVAYDIVEDN